MLIKVGRHYLTLGTFNFDAKHRTLYHPSGYGELLPEEAKELESILDSIIAAQQTIDEQVRLQKEATEKLSGEIQRVAQYEKELMQKAAQVDAAYAAMQQQSSVILPPGFGRKRG